MFTSRLQVVTNCPTRDAFEKLKTLLENNHISYREQGWIVFYSITVTDAEGADLVRSMI